MSPTVWSPIYLLLCYVTLSVGFEIPGLNTDNCFPEVKQACDVEASLTKADVFALNSTVRYFLFTRKNPTDPEMLHLCNGTLPRNTNFNSKRRLILIIPGYLLGMCQLLVYQEIKDEFLKKDDYNVLLIDTRQEYGLDYIDAVQNLPAVAEEVVKVLKNIQYQTGIKNDNVEIVGHSLGAQLAGHISQHFRLHRITGVDPAGVNFEEEKPKSARLDAGDAHLVDILHCNGGKGLPSLSMDYPTGHADFFINGGILQLGCRDLAMKAMKGYDFLIALAVGTGPSICSHLICMYFYQLTINNEHGRFKAWECDNYADFKGGKCTGSEPVIMGFEYEKNFTRGRNEEPFPRKYFLDTTENWPYVIKNDTTIKKKLGKLYR